MSLPCPLKPIPLTFHHHLHFPPIIFFPIQDSIRALSPVQYKLKKSNPLFREDIEDAELTTATQNMTINEQTEEDPDIPEQVEQVEYSSEPNDWWKIVAEKGNKKAQRLTACAIGEEGDLLVAVGENEEIWVWRKGL